MIKPIGIATTLTLSALLLSACGGGSSDDEAPPTSTPPPTPPPTATYTVTASADEGGSISPGSATVEEGDTTSFSLSTDEGYNIAAVSGCGGSLDGSTYTTASITEDCSVNASFELQTFSVSATANDGGQVSPGSQDVAYGEQATVSYSANTGFELHSIQGCGGESSGNGSFTTAAITEACSIEASFSLLTFTVAATASEGGAVTPESQTVNYGEQATFEISIDEGYQLTNTTGCAGELNDAVFTTEALTESCTLNVEFEQETFELSATIGEGGTISPALQTINWGEDAEFTISLEEGFAIDSIEGCEGELNSIGEREYSYSMEAVSSDCQLAVELKIDLARPVLTDVEQGDTEFTLAWNHVDYAQQYNLYLATEQGVTPDNFNVLDGGDIYLDIESPFTVEELDNETTYFFVVTAVAYEFESQPSREQFVTPQEPFVANGGLNDVGVLFCSDNTFDNHNCPLTDFPGQAGDTGRDAAARVGELEKQGGGYAGFDFTKLNQFGAVLQDQERSWQFGGSEAEGTRWTCVRDNTTGLYWHIASDEEEHPLSRPLVASWYNPDPDVNGGNPGRDNVNSHNRNSMELVEAANELQLCGFDDWRISEFNELYGLMNFSGTVPMIDMHYFPDTPTESNTVHHTGTTSATNVGASRAINLRTGTTYARGKQYVQHFKLVRGEEAYVYED